LPYQHGFRDARHPAAGCSTPNRHDHLVVVSTAKLASCSLWDVVGYSDFMRWLSAWSVRKFRWVLVLRCAIGGPFFSQTTAWQSPQAPMASRSGGSRHTGSHLGSLDCLRRRAALALAAACSASLSRSPLLWLPVASIPGPAVAGGPWAFRFSSVAADRWLLCCGGLRFHLPLRGLAEILARAVPDGLPRSSRMLYCPGFPLPVAGDPSLGITQDLGLAHQGI